MSKLFSLLASLFLSSINLATPCETPFRASLMNLSVVVCLLMKLRLSCSMILLISYYTTGILRSPSFLELFFALRNYISFPSVKFSCLSFRYSVYSRFKSLLYDYSSVMFIFSSLISFYSIWFLAFTLAYYSSTFPPKCIELVGSWLMSLSVCILGDFSWWGESATLLWMMFCDFAWLTVCLWLATCGLLFMLVLVLLLTLC